MASEHHDIDRSPDDGAAPARVSTYLGRLEAKRRSARRNRLVALGVGAAVGAVAWATAAGIAPTEARDLAASAGAIVVGFALSRA